MDLQNEAIELQKIFHKGYKTYWEETEAIKTYLEERNKALNLPIVSNRRELFDAVLDFSEELPMCSEDYHRSELWEKFKQH